MYNVTAAGLATGCEIVNLCDAFPRDLQDVSSAMGGVNLTHSKNANRTSGKGKQLTTISHGEKGQLVQGGTNLKRSHAALTHQPQPLVAAPFFLTHL